MRDKIKQRGARGIIGLQRVFKVSENALREHKIFVIVNLESPQS